MLAAAGTEATPPFDARGLLRGAVFHYGRLVANGHRTLREVARALDARPDERVLDVGCGTGGFCRAVPGEYVGIDLDAAYVGFARWRWASPRRQFETTALDQLDPRAGFDGAIMVNALHHMSDRDAAAVLARLAVLVRRRLVVADADPEASNALQALLLRWDRGDFVRARRAQRRLLETAFRVVDEGRFRNTPHTLVQTLFVCEPRP
ncbi:MAG TPA: methyltransferase domain-containing protein [Candidatus Binatia bacterium]|nr:methyltransferase domain-containing protein [Candidatus Binatia bacterium]